LSFILIVNPVKARVRVGVAITTSSEYVLGRRLPAQRGRDARRGRQRCGGTNARGGKTRLAHKPVLAGAGVVARGAEDARAGLGDALSGDSGEARENKT